MIKVELLRELLKIDEKNVESIDTEKLRVVLGAARYFVRVAERELNRREEELDINTNE